MSELDDVIVKILAPFQIVVVSPGEILCCAYCGVAVNYTYRRLCGRCFLQGRTPKIN